MKLNIFNDINDFEEFIRIFLCGYSWGTVHAFPSEQEINETIAEMEDNGLLDTIRNTYLKEHGLSE